MFLSINITHIIEPCLLAEQYPCTADLSRTRTNNPNYILYKNRTETKCLILKYGLRLIQNKSRFPIVARISAVHEYLAECTVVCCVGETRAEQFTAINLLGNIMSGVIQVS